MGILEVRTLLYHPQANGQVEWAHQMLVQMIGKLSKDQKADWPKHLADLVHAYNSMRLAITGYSPHHLMFGWQPCLPIDFYFPTIMSTEKHQHVNHYVDDLHGQLCKAFKEVQVQSTSEAERQRWYYDCKANAISLQPGDQVLAKADAYKGRRKVKECWGEELYEVECRIAEGVPPYLMKNQLTGCSQALHWNWLFLITPIMGAPLYSGVQAEQMRYTTTILEEPTQKVSENKEAQQSVKCLPLAQCQTGETPLVWVNRKLCVFQRMFSGASLIDQGWKVWCRGKRMCRHQHQHSGGRGTDHTDEVWKIWPTTISSILPFFILEIASSKHGGAWNRHAGPCLNLWDDHFILNTDAMETPGISYVRDTYHCCPIPRGQGTLLHKLTWNLGGNHWEKVGISNPPWFESVKLFSLSNMSNAWHKRQNFVYMYKCWVAFIEFCALMFYRTVKKVYDKVKVEHHGTVNKLTRDMRVCMVE